MATGQVQILINASNTGLTNSLNQSKREIKNFSREIDSAGKGVKNLLSGNWQLLGGLVAGAAIYQMVRKVGQFNDSIRRLGIDSNMTTAEMLAFKDQVTNTGISTGVAVNDLTQMSTAAFNSSKNIKFVREELTFMAKVAQASGAPAGQLGEFLGDLQETTGLTGEKFEDLVKTLGAFSKTDMSKSTLANFLPSSDRLVSIAKNIDPTIGKNFQKILFEGMIAGQPEQVAKAYSKLMSRENKKYLKGLGFDPKEFNTISSVISKIMGTEGRTKTEKLGLIGTILGIKSTADLENLINGVSRLGTEMTEADKENFMAGSKVAATGFQASLNRLETSMLTIKDKALAPAIEEIGKAFANLDPKDLKALIELFTGLGKAIAGTISFMLKIPGASDKAGVALHRIVSGMPDLEKGATEPIVSGFNALPIERRREMIAQLEKEGKVNIGNNGAGISMKNETNVYIDGVKTTPSKVVTKTTKTGQQGTVTSTEAK